MPYKIAVDWRTPINTKRIVTIAVHYLLLWGLTDMSPSMIDKVQGCVDTLAFKYDISHMTRLMRNQISAVMTMLHNSKTDAEAMKNIAQAEQEVKAIYMSKNEYSI